MMSQSDFSDLNEFVAKWGLPTAHKRLARRTEATMGEIESFYQAIVPRLEDIISFLNQFPVDGIPQEFLPLAHTALAACEIDDAVNVWKSPALDYATDMRTWRVKASFYDYR